VLLFSFFIVFGRNFRKFPHLLFFFSFFFFFHGGNSIKKVHGGRQPLKCGRYPRGNVAQEAAT